MDIGRCVATTGSATQPRRGFGPAMDRSNRRKVAAAGALAVLATWFGGLSLACADEPGHDGTSVAVTAGARLSAGTATGTTPPPSPSVEPTAPLTPAAAAPSPGSTSLPDPGPAPSTGAEQPAQPPEDVPSPTTAPTASEATPEHQTPSHAAAGSIVIDDFDCAALSTTVRIDRPGGQGPDVYTIVVMRWSAGWQEYWQHTVTVAPSAVQTVKVPLPNDSHTRVTVQSQHGGWAEKLGTCGTFVLDPRSTIAPFDCTGLSVSVVFDNTRSTSAVTFSAAVTGDVGFSSGSDSVSQNVQAGKEVTVSVHLYPDAVNQVTVFAYGIGETELATSAKQTCGYVRHATVDPLDCGNLTATITLNNASVPVPTRFTIQVGNGWIQRFRTSVLVPAGTRKQVVVPLRNNSTNDVEVRGPTGWLLGEQSDVCGTDLGAQGRIGNFDCTSLSAQVTLDASASEMTEWFMISTGDTNNHATLKYYRVAAGSTKVVRVHLTRHARTYVNLYAGTTFDDEDSNLLASRDGSCGLATVSKVSCTTMTVSVTLYGYDGWRGPVHYRVSSTRHADDAAAYSRELVVRRGTTKVVKVPLTALAGGKLRVEDLDWNDVMYEKRIAAHCSAPSGSTTDSANAWSSPTALAATGAADLPQLALAGAAMLACGTAALSLSRTRS